jgi:hypothetical protein
MPLSHLLELVKKICSILIASDKQGKSNKETYSALSQALVISTNSKNINVNAYDSIIGLAYIYSEKMATSIQKHITYAQNTKLQNLLTTEKQSWWNRYKQYVFGMGGLVTLGLLQVALEKYKIISPIENKAVVSNLIKYTTMVSYKMYAFAKASTVIQFAMLGGISTSVYIFRDKMRYLMSKSKIALSKAANKVVSYVSNPTRDSRMIESICVNELPKVDVPEDVIFRLTKPDKTLLNRSSIETLKGNCTCEHPDHKKKILTQYNDVKTGNDALIYDPCYYNNTSSIVRQCAKVTNPDVKMLEKFKKFFDNIMEVEIKPILSGFTVSHKQWYNHLEASKQLEQNEYIDEKGNIRIDIDHASKTADSHIYDNFVKSEKQFMDGNEKPKTRCICAPGSYLKFIMGPVVIEMEKRFKKDFFGYKGPNDWSELERTLAEWDTQGFTHTLQLDGSGFDRTQHESIKLIVDEQIYSEVARNELHIDPEIFKANVKIKPRMIRNVIRTGKKKTAYGFVILKGKTFSGSPDTTLMNTTRMTLYNRFVNEELGHLTKDVDYKLLDNGDDVVAVYKDLETLNAMHKLYQTVFVNKKDADNVSEHGLGQIAKFYKIET